MTAEIQYIAFDLGRVIVDWNPDYLFASLFDDRARRQYMLETVVTLDWIEEVDRGKPLHQAVEERKSLYPEYAIELDAYGARWLETIPRLIDGTVDIKNQVEAKGYKTYALSNFGTDTYADAVEVFPVLAEFEGAVISGHEGYIKPEPEIYQILLDRYKLVPEQLLFIDDRADNVAQAHKLGIQAVQFTSPEALQSDLERLNVL